MDSKRDKLGSGMLVVLEVKSMTKRFESSKMGLCETFSLMNPGVFISQNLYILCLANRLML